VEPVEGLQSLIRGQEGSISAVSAAPRGGILRAPDMYMSKLIVGPGAKGTIDIDAPISGNVRAIAEAIGRRPEEITVAVLGEMQARMWPTQRAQVDKLAEYGFGEPERKLTLDDLIREDDVVFVATGITPGEPLNGVRCFRGGARTHTVVMSTEPRVVRFMDTIHALEPEAGRKGSQL